MVVCEFANALHCVLLKPWEIEAFWVHQWQWTQLLFYHLCCELSESILWPLYCGCELSGSCLTLLVHCFAKQPLCSSVCFPGLFARIFKVFGDEALTASECTYNLCVHLKVPVLAVAEMNSELFWLTLCKMPETARIWVLGTCAKRRRSRFVFSVPSCGVQQSFLPTLLGTN